jgi:hypothetical protein
MLSVSYIYVTCALSTVPAVEAKPLEPTEGLIQGGGSRESGELRKRPVWGTETMLRGVAASAPPSERVLGDGLKGGW